MAGSNNNTTTTTTVVAKIATATKYPTLNGLGLPEALTKSITQAYELIYGLRDALVATVAAGGGGFSPGGGVKPPSGTPGPTPPPSGAEAPDPVVITGYTVTQRFNDLFEVQVTYTVPSTDTAANYTGCAVYIEDPDISSMPVLLLDHSKLGGTTGGVTTPPSNVSGATVPLRDNDSFVSPADIMVPAETTARNVRIYLAAYGPNTSPELIRANAKSGTPTPSISVPIPAVQSTYTLGMEVAWLVTGVSVVVNPKFSLVPPMYSLTFQYTPPTVEEEDHRPQGIGNFGGVDIWYKYSDGSFANTGIHKYVYGNPTSNPPPVSWTSDDYSAQNGSFRCYFVSANDQYQENTIQQNTPYVDVTISITATKAPSVTGLKLCSPITYQWQLDGSFDAVIDLCWTLPTSNANLLSYISPYIINVTQPSGVTWPAGYAPTVFPQMIPDSNRSDSSEGSQLIYMGQIPTQCEEWTVAAVSTGFDGQLVDPPSSYAVGDPNVIQFEICPPSPNQQYASSVTMVASPWPTPPYVENTSSDGVRVVSFNLGTSSSPAWTNPSDTRFSNAYVVMVVGGTYQNPYAQWAVPAGQNYFTTPYVAAPGNPGQGVRIDFFILSENAQGLINPLIPSGANASPDMFLTAYTPSPGQIKASLLPTGWFNTSDFVWPNPSTGGLFAVNTIAANKIYVGQTLVVGGAPAGSAYTTSTFSGSSPGTTNIPTRNGQIAVYSSGAADPGGVPTLRAWMGEQGVSGQLIYGGWFSALYVGGLDPTTSPLYVNNGGMVQVGGWDVTTKIGGVYPYISIRDKYDTEVGRIGADIEWAMSPNPGFSLHGAWFSQFAAGGYNLGNYKVLIDTSGNFTIKDIDQMILDYPAVAAGAYPYNYHYQVQLGRNVWGAGYSGTNPSQPWYRFPGMTIYEVGTNAFPQVFGTTLLNRGIVMRGGPGATNPNNPYGNAVLGSLVMWNGDQNGSDTPVSFWTELSMYSPTDASKQTVYLSSGFVTGYSGFTPLNSNNPIFNMIDSNGDFQFQVDLYHATMKFQRNKYPAPGGGYKIQNLLSVDGQGNVIPGNGYSGVLIFQVMDSNRVAWYEITFNNGILTNAQYIGA